MDVPDKQPEFIRLSKVARDCNIAMNTLVEFLCHQGHEVDGNPNTKIPYTVYEEVLSAFQQDKENRERSREAFELHKARFPDTPITHNSSDMNEVWMIQGDPGMADPVMLVHDAADQEIAAAGFASVLDENVEDRKRKEESTGDHIILMDIFLTFKDPEYQHRQDLGGIALLKFLRMKEVSNHIVLLSPWNLQQLLRMEPDYHILASKGITIAQYTYSLDELRTHDGVELDLAELAEEKAPKKEVLRDYFKAGISLPKDERHNWANWWGIYALVEIQRAHYPNDTQKHWSLPAPVREKLKQLRNAEVKYIYDQLQVSGAQVLACLDPVAAHVVYIDDQVNEGWSDVLKGLLDENSRQAFRSFIPAAGALKDAIGIEDFFSQKDETQTTTLEGALKDCEILLLDLRLDPGSDRELGQGKEENLSGVRLLKAIRERYPGIPVLMFSASSAGLVRERLISNGVDRVWTKPGLDLSGRLDQWLICELRDALVRLAQADYQALKTLGDRVASAQSSWISRWWNTSVLSDGYQLALLWDVEGTKRDSFFQIVHGILYQIRSLLQRFQEDEPMQLEDNERPDRSFALANLINRSGSLVEYLHFDGVAVEKSELLFQTSSTAIPQRHDCLGWMLVQMRHNASHYSSMRRTQRRHLLFVMDVLGRYLGAAALPDAQAMERPVRKCVFKRQMAYRRSELFPWWSRTAHSLPGIVQDQEAVFARKIELAATPSAKAKLKLERAALRRCSTDDQVPGFHYRDIVDDFSDVLKSLYP